MLSHHRTGQVKIVHPSIEKKQNNPQPLLIEAIGTKIKSNAEKYCRNSQVTNTPQPLHINKNTEDLKEGKL